MESRDGRMLYNSLLLMQMQTQPRNLIPGQPGRTTMRKGSPSGLDILKGPPWSLMPPEVAVCGPCWCPRSWWSLRSMWSYALCAAACLMPWWCPQIFLPQGAILMWVACVATSGHVETHDHCSWWGPSMGWWSWHSQGLCWCLQPVLPLKPYSTEPSRKR